jgi:hypothetical protein
VQFHQLLEGVTRDELAWHQSFHSLAKVAEAAELRGSKATGGVAGGRERRDDSVTRRPHAGLGKHPAVLERTVQSLPTFFCAYAASNAWERDVHKLE